MEAPGCNECFHLTSKSFRLEIYVCLDLLHPGKVGGWNDVWKTQSPGRKKTQQMQKKWNIERKSAFKSLQVSTSCGWDQLRHWLWLSLTPARTLEEDCGSIFALNLKQQHVSSCEDDKLGKVSFHVIWTGWLCWQSTDKKKKKKRRKPLECVKGSKVHPLKIKMLHYLLNRARFSLFWQIPTSTIKYHIFLTIADTSGSNLSLKCEVFVQKPGMLCCYKMSLFPGETCWLGLRGSCAASAHEGNKTMLSVRLQNITPLFISPILNFS